MQGLLAKPRASWFSKWEPSASCVLWLPGQDDPQSTTIRDRSGNGNNGTISGGATWVRLSSGLWCNEFDMVDGVITVAASASFEDIFDGGGTILGWIYPHSDGEDDAGSVLDTGRTYEAKGWVLMTVSEAAGLVMLDFIQKFSTTEGEWKTTSTTFPINTWSFFAVTYNNGATTNNPIIYYNNTVPALTKVRTPVGTRVSDTTQPLRIGSLSLGRRAYDGLQALQRAFTAILTPTVLNGIYNQERHLFGV